MTLFAQAGLGGVAKAAAGILALFWYAAILAYILFLVLWYGCNRQPANERKLLFFKDLRGLNG